MRGNRVMLYSFPPFTLDLTSFQLLKDGRAIAVSPQSLEVLSYLVSRSSMLVTKDDLFRAVWPDVFVTDNALARVVSDLRAALGDDPARPRFVQTVARRGYRFIAPIRHGDAGDDAPIVRARHSRETASLDAARLVSNGRLCLESFDHESIAIAITHFGRAIAFDPGFAPAYIGLALAHFWQYESVRHRTDARADLLALAIEHARCALRLDPLFAESHASLSLFLAAAGQGDDARRAARRALALEPNYWAHHFRYAHASWGDERLRALQRCHDLYPEFAFAYFQAAMVHIARNRLEQAEQMLHRGTVVQDGAAARRLRFPSNGLHWLLGLLKLRRGDANGAMAEFEEDQRSGRGQLYTEEFDLAARTAGGFASLARHDVPGAIETFQQALTSCDEQPRAQIGLSIAFNRAGRRREAQIALRTARAQIDALARAGRSADAAMFLAGVQATEGQPEEAITTLRTLVSEMPPGPAGWLIPVEPSLAPLRSLPGYDDVLRVLFVRAR